MERGEVSLLRGERGILQKGKPVAAGVWTHGMDAPSVRQQTGPSTGQSRGIWARIPAPEGKQV